MQSRITLETKGNVMPTKISVKLSIANAVALAAYCEEFCLRRDSYLNKILKDANFKGIAVTPFDTKLTPHLQRSFFLTDEALDYLKQYKQNGAASRDEWFNAIIRAIVDNNPSLYLE